MKRAKVSSVYEGKRRRRRSWEEEEIISRRARMHAKARKYAHRAASSTTAHHHYHSSSATAFVITSEKRVTTRSMIRTTARTGDEGCLWKVKEETEVVVDLVLVKSIAEAVPVPQPKTETTSGESRIVNEAAAEAEKEAEEAVGATNARMARWGSGGSWWEWPFLLTYEEELMWMGNVSTRWLWEVTSDLGQPPAEEDEERPWVNDIWNLKDMEQVPK